MNKEDKDAKSQTKKAALRKKADKIARKADTHDNIDTMSPEERRILLHELRVHQIELEMQNEELRRAQEQLDTERARYFDLYDLAPIGYLTVSEQGLILEANLTAASLLGVSRSTLHKALMTRFIIKEDQDNYYHHRKKLFDTGQLQKCELRMVKKDGTVFWAQLMATTAQNEEGKAICRILISDISEHNQYEEVQTFLAQTSSGTPIEPFFHALARYLAQSLEMDFVCIDSLEGDGLTARTVAVWCDGHFEDNVSYALKDTPCGEVVGKAICCFPASVCQFFPRDQVLQDLKAESYIGTTVWSHEGEPIGLIALIKRSPLTKRVLAENTLKMVAIRAAGEMERLKAEDALRKSELKYRSMIECSSDAIFCVDEKGEYKFTNQLFAATFGKTPKYFIGKTFWDIYPQEHADQRYGITKRVFQTGKSESVEVAVPLSDRTLYFYATANPIKDDTGKVVLSMTHATDITARKLAEEEKRIIEERLQRAEKMESLGLLAGGVAHDLNNVLGIVVGYAEMINEDIDESNPLKEDPPILWTE
ncbi:MAG TPA: PAS domain S-box protein, partial [Candidatus Syntrophosphaera sp.]|nr:PAS domain S-box protein [Candidatus Syntrophosphaera sp.]